MIIRGSIQAFKDKDILKYIDQATLDEIKKTDPNPLFKKYSVAHEGVSKPKVLGEGIIPISWGQRAIRTVKDAIKTGIQCIAGHTIDNVKRREKVVARVVGKGEEIINGILNAIIVNYFPDKTDADYDVISMEADLDWYNNGHEMGIAEGITALARFALGKSENDIPAFSDAKLLGSIQCFEQSEKEKNQSLGEPSKERKVPTFAEIKLAVKEMNIYPSQLYTREEITGEVVIEPNGQITFRGGDAQITTYLAKKIPSPEEILKDSVEKIKKFEEQIKTLEPQVSELQKLKTEQAKLTATDDIIKYATEKKLTKKQIEFIKINLDNYKPSDNKEESIKTFVEAQTTNYQKFLKIHPESVENPLTKDSEKDSSLEQSELETKLEMY